MTISAGSLRLCKRAQPNEISLTIPEVTLLPVENITANLILFCYYGKTGIRLCGIFLNKCSGYLLQTW